MIKITIDGFNGTGKTTLAKNMAKELGFTYISMGIIFRCISYELTQKYNDNSYSEDDIVNVIDSIKIILPSNNQNNVFVNDTCVTKEIKDMKYADISSRISNNPIFQERVRNIIRNYSNYSNVIVDGRDTGKLLFPDADIKFLLVSDLNVRALRRAKELGKTNENDISIIVQSMMEIDRRLIEGNCTPPQDAIRIDTTEMSAQDVLFKCLGIVKSNLKTLKQNNENVLIKNKKNHH